MTDWSTKATSFSYDQKEIIGWIIKLHNGGNPFELDPTFSRGVFWRGLEEPRLKFDLVPQRPDVIQGDVRQLPLESNSISSIMFDPPFVVGSDKRGKGIIRDRFSSFRTEEGLWTFYKESLQELDRILQPNGIIAFKCQDMISGGNNYMSHAFVIVEAQKLGLYVKDLFVLGRKNVLWSPNMANQKNARKNHCYFLVLQKTNITNSKAKTFII